MEETSPNRRLNWRVRNGRKRGAAFAEALMRDFDENGAKAIEEMRKHFPAKYLQLIESVVTPRPAAPRKRAERAAAAPEEDEPALTEEEQREREAYFEALRAGSRTEPGR